MRQVLHRRTRRVLQRIEMQSQPAVQRHVVPLEPPARANGLVVPAGRWVFATTAVPALPPGEATTTIPALPPCIEDGPIIIDEPPLSKGGTLEMDAPPATLEVTLDGGGDGDVAELVWVRGRVTRVYALLRAGETYTQPSFAGDTWLVCGTHPTQTRAHRRHVAL